MPDKTFPCPACGAPVSPIFGQKRTTCPYCGVTVTTPEGIEIHPSLEEVLASVRAALARGNKIEAIRLYREGTGVGLKEAKDVVEQMEADYTPHDAAESNGMEQKVVETLRQAAPIANSALRTYAWWAIFKRLLPGCIIATVIGCLLACGAIFSIILMARQGG